MVQMQAQGYLQPDGRLVLTTPHKKPPENKMITFFWEEESTKGVTPTTQKKLKPEQQAILDVLSSLEGEEKASFTKDDLESFEKLERGDFKFGKKPPEFVCNFSATSN